MSVMGGNDLNVKVDANTSGYEQAIARAERQTKTFEYALRQAARAQQEQERQVRAAEEALQRQHNAMTKAGTAVFAFGAAIAAGLGLAVNEAVKWESAWTGVTKTVDGTDAQMKELEGGLRKLALTLPATHEEIAGVAEAAGQLGVAREDVLGFTKTMIDLSETTNLTADQAATDLARFSNIMQTPTSEVDRLGSSIVELGNNSATTEAEIVSMATRIAGAGAQLGMTEGEVFGLAAALSSVGVEAEAGGSAISVVMKNIQTAVSEGGEDLAQYAAVAGMSADEFATAWQINAAGALDSFVVGLGNVKSAGGDVIGTLNDLGIKQIRQSDALLRLAGAGDLLTESLELGNDAYEENNALLEEAEKRYGTTEAKVQIARNAMRDAAITVGGVLLPVLGSVAETVSNLVTVWQSMPGPIKTGAVVLAALAAALALAGGAALIAIPKIAAFRTAVAGLEAGALRTAGTRLMGLGSFLMGPWGIALAAGAAALTIFASKQGAAQQQVDALRATLDEQTGALTENSREWAKKELLESGAYTSAKELGVSLSLVTDAALGNAEAMEKVRDAVREARAQGEAGLATKLMNDLLDVKGVVDEGTTSWQLMEEAGDGATGSLEGTDAAAGNLGGTLSDVAGETGELTEEIKTLGEELEDLSGNYLNNRDAARAVRDSQRSIASKLKELREEHGAVRDSQGKLNDAYKAGTVVGDELAGMLDGLAKDYLNQLDAAERNGASEKRLQEIHREGRRSLIETGVALGMTREAARKYADQILQTPKNIKTRFETNGLAESYRQLSAYEAAMSALDGRVVRTYVASQRLPGQTGGGLTEADGGIVEKRFANGGMNAAGGYVPRISQIVQGGADIRWGEPETGWEAYISGKPGMRARNEQIWLEAGRRLGLVENAETLRQAQLGGRTFASGGFAGSGGVVESLVRQLGVAGRRVDSAPRRVVLQVGAREFTGYMREVADEQIGDRDALDTTKGRMYR